MVTLRSEPTTPNGPRGVIHLSKLKEAPGFHGISNSSGSPYKYRHHDVKTEVFLKEMKKLISDCDSEERKGLNFSRNYKPFNLPPAMSKIVEKM